MEFYMWLFSVKKMAASYSQCRSIYMKLPEIEQKNLKSEYYSEISQEQQTPATKAANEEFTHIMGFYMWLFCFKKLASSYCKTLLIYERLPATKKSELFNEYEENKKLEGEEINEN